MVGNVANEDACTCNPNSWKPTRDSSLLGGGQDSNLLGIHPGKNRKTRAEQRSLEEKKQKVVEQAQPGDAEQLMSPPTSVQGASGRTNTIRRPLILPQVEYDERFSFHDEMNPLAARKFIKSTHLTGKHILIIISLGELHFAINFYLLEDFLIAL
ncbi:hypothetical protein SLEP1_g28656 [Rubroshorea leprosula]|uniref:Uncharacterized protein n=1 Tax=Rubroshorea leprosula TaxID=152421 RepID=A0AAV5JUB7_9ROSI|nr:hypothetical protein SLEP1_g28656 [Rubroshorea leprosula]